MELLTYPTALVFASVMSVILVSPIVFFVAAWFDVWIGWITTGKVKYINPIHRWYNNYLANTSNYPNKSSFVYNKDIELVYPIITAIFTVLLICFIVIEPRSGSSFATATDKLTYAYFGVWFKLGSWAAAPIFIVLTALGASHGARYMFTLYDKVASRLQSVEGKAHTHD